MTTAGVDLLAALHVSMGGRIADLPPVPAQFCAAEHPFDPATLCRHLCGHTGTHASDPDCDWDTDPTHPKENDRD